MKRRRRTSEAAKTEILDIAQNLLLKDGPSSLRLELIAREMKVSHPTILHHFGSIDGVLTALQQRVSREVRQDLLTLIRPAEGPEERLRAISSALKEISKPEKGRLIAWLVANGQDPFPPVEEQGMAKVAQELRQDEEKKQEADSELMNVMLLGLLAMVGESLVGDDVRARLGTQADVPNRDQFREWLLKLLVQIRTEKS